MKVDTEEDFEIRFAIFKMIWAILWYQTVAAMIPNLLYIICTRAHLEQITDGLGEPGAEDYTIIHLIRNYFVNSLHQQKSYVFKFHAIEMINILNMVGQITLLHYFFSLDIFTTFEEFSAVMAEAFPCEIICRLYEESAGEDDVKKDKDKSQVAGFEKDLTHCIYPKNSVAKGVFMMLYVWMLLLVLLGLLTLGMRLMLCCSVWLRVKKLQRICGSWVPKEDIKLLVKKLSYSDFVVLENIVYHLPSIYVMEFIYDLRMELSPPKIKNV